MADGMHGDADGDALTVAETMSETDGEAENLLGEIDGDGNADGDELIGAMAISCVPAEPPGEPADITIR